LKQSLNLRNRLTVAGELPLKVAPNPNPKRKRPKLKKSTSLAKINLRVKSLNVQSLPNPKSRNATADAADDRNSSR